MTASIPSAHPGIEMYEYVPAGESHPVCNASYNIKLGEVRCFEAYKDAQQVYKFPFKGFFIVSSMVGQGKQAAPISDGFHGFIRIREISGWNSDLDPETAGGIEKLTTTKMIAPQ